MENKEKLCCCLTDDRELLKAGIVEASNLMEVGELKELYMRAMEIRSGRKAAETVKEKMIQYMVGRMQEADAGKVRTLFLCATNIL